MQRIYKNRFLKTIFMFTLVILTTAPAVLAKENGPGLKLDKSEWMVFDNETFYPILDNLHAVLNTAFQEYGHGNYESAADHLKAGAQVLRAQAVGLPDSVAFKDRGAASKLEAVAAKVSSQTTNEKELQLAIERAYMTDWNPQWIVSQNDTAVDILNRPGQHMAEALMNFKNAMYQDSAFDLRQAAIYVDLTKGVGPESRELRELAHEVTLPKNERPSLNAVENVIIEVSRSLADNDMDQAILEKDTGKARAHLSAGLVTAGTVLNDHNDAKDSSKNLESAINNAKKALKTDSRTAKQDLVKAAEAVQNAL